MSSPVTVAELKEFSDWTKIDSQHTLLARFGRSPLGEEITEYEGPLRYYDPQWRPIGRPVGPGLRLVPGDFLGILTSGSDPTAQVIVSLEAKNPADMVALFVGGALDGVSVESTTVLFDDFHYPGIDIWLYFVDTPYQYTLQIVKIPVPPH